MQAYLFVGVGGALGSILRYLCSLLSVHLVGEHFPSGTIFVNLLGSFFLGFFLKRFSGKMDPKWGAAISTGVIGSFTTLSTFSVDVVALLTSGRLLAALSYLLISVCGGLGFAYFGLIMGAKGRSA